MLRKRIKHVPTVLQIEAVECGAASLTMILAYYKKYATLEEVRERCGVNRDGSKASNILKAARGYGLDAQGYRKDTESVIQLEMPLIIHWDMSHFLVLEGYHEGKFYLNDPGGGRRTVDRDTFNKSFTGIAISFSKTAEFQESGNKNSTIILLNEKLNKYLKELVYISFTGFVMTFPALLLAWLAKVFLDEILLNGRTQWISGLLLGLLIVAILKGLSSYVFRILTYQMLEKMRLSETSRLLWKTIHLPITFFMQRFSGEISARVKNVDNVVTFMAIDWVNSMASVLAILIYIAVMLSYNVTLTVIVLFFFIVNMVILGLNTKTQENINNRISMSHMRLMGASISGIQLIETIKTVSAEQDFFEKWSGYQAKLIDEKQEAGAKIQGLLNLPPLISMLATVTVLFSGGYLIIHGDLTVGSLVAFQSIVASFFVSSATLNQTGIKLPKVMADIKRIEDIYRYPNEGISYGPKEAEDINISLPLEGNLRVEGLTFGFSPYEPPLIKDFSLELNSGQRIALVGSSGSGKSTIAKLIAGIYKPWSGEMYIDNIPIQELSKSLVNNSIAMVDQEIILFAGTVSENISLWQENIEEEKLTKAAMDACIHDDIIIRAGGYEHKILEEGQNFSGGQRQRIEIARALLQSPCIMILDEATSALDPATELKIDNNIRKRGSSCIIVAHRLSTIRDCDEIIVLNKGKIVQRGTHEALVDQEGLYAELIKTM